LFPSACPCYRTAKWVTWNVEQRFDEGSTAVPGSPAPSTQAQHHHPDNIQHSCCLNTQHTMLNSCSCIPISRTNSNAHLLQIYRQIYNVEFMFETLIVSCTNMCYIRWTNLTHEAYYIINVTLAKGLSLRQGRGWHPPFWYAVFRGCLDGMQYAKGRYAVRKNSVISYADINFYF